MPTLRNSALSVALLTAGHFLSDFYSNFLPALLPVVMTKLGLSLAASGLLVMVYSFTSSILQPLCGFFVDKYGLAWLVLITMPISAFFICLTGLASNYSLLLICVAVAGLGSSLFHPLGSSLVSKVTSPENRGLSMSIFIGGGNFGFAVAPAIVIFFLVHFGTENLIWLMAPALLLTAAYYLYRLYRFDLAAPKQLPNTSAGQWYKSISLLKLNIVMGLRSWTQMALPNFLPLWLAQQGQVPTLAGSMLTVYLMGGAMGGFLGGWFGDRFGRKTCILSALTICLPAMALFLYNREVSLLTWAALAISGASLQGTLPSSIVWAQDIIPANAAMASGMMLGLSFGLGGVGTAITGVAADYVGLQTALLWSLAPLVVAIPLAYSIPEKNPKPCTTNQI
jgi:FSR family fosmidomycin resistance protein-like MFS transporter